jgi:hypothetical protein
VNSCFNSKENFSEEVVEVLMHLTYFSQELAFCYLVKEGLQSQELFQPLDFKMLCGKEQFCNDLSMPNLL